MKRITGLLAIAAMLSTTAGATILIDLPDLTGAYAVGDNPPPGSSMIRTMTFALPDSIGSIEELRFVASGPWTNGKYETCREIGGFVYCDTLPYLSYMTLQLTAGALGACHFRATSQTNDGLFANELLFEVCLDGQSDVNLLLGTVITAELFCDIPAANLPRVVEAAYGTADQVHLEAVGAVETRPSTWGAVKAIYR